MSGPRLGVGKLFIPGCFPATYGPNQPASFGAPTIMPASPSVPRTRRATHLPAQAVSALRKALGARAQEMEAGKKDWIVAPLSLEGGAPSNSSGPMLDPANASKAVRFFNAKGGNTSYVERNIRDGCLTILEPFSACELHTIKTIVFRKYQFFFFAEKAEPVVLACVGSRPTSLIYPVRKTIIQLNNKENPYNFISALLATIKPYGAAFYRYLSEDTASKTACIIGDERPTHYLRESLGSLQKLEDSGRLDAFWDQLDYLIIPIDYAFIPADELFPIPPSVKIVYVPLTELNRFIFDRNLFVQRLMRSGHYMTEELRDRIVNFADKDSRALAWSGNARIFSKPDITTVWFSVEIEKGRIQNQQEVFQSMIGRLAHRLGSNFRLVVDGWSPMPLFVSAKDKKIATQIRSFIRQQTVGAPVEFDVVHVSHLPYRDKIMLCRKSDFFVSMQGAAALVPSGICHKPGITYHNTWGLSSMTEVWPENLHQVKARKETLGPGQHPGRATFEVDIEAFETALDALLDNLEHRTRPSTKPTPAAPSAGS